MQSLWELFTLYIKEHSRLVNDCLVIIQYLDIERGIPDG